MKTIQKYILPPPGSSVVGFDLPLNAQVVYANVLGEQAFLFVWVGKNRSLTKKRHFAVVDTDWELPENAEYVCSFRDQRGIWHVIERKDGLH